MSLLTSVWITVLVAILPTSFVLCMPAYHKEARLKSTNEYIVGYIALSFQSTDFAHHVL